MGSKFALRLLALAFGGEILSMAARAEADELEEVRIRGNDPGSAHSTASVAREPREVTDVGDWLEREPGVHVRKLGGDDGFSTLSIRGSNGNQVAVYLAGIPLTGGADPTLDVSTLPLFGGTTARLDRTFSKATLGPSTLGGTLNLEPTTSTSERAWLAAGSFGTARMRAAEKAHLGTSELRLSLAGSRSEGDFTYYDDRTGSFRPRKNAGHAKVSGYVQGIVRDDDRRERLKTHTLIQLRKQDLPGSVAAPTQYENFGSSRVVQGLELPLTFNRSAQVTLRAWGRHESTRVIGGYDVFSPFRRETAARSLALGGSAGVDSRPSRSFDLAARLEGELQGWVPGLYENVPPPPKTTRSRVGIGADAIVHARKDLDFALSARGDLFVDKSAVESKSELLPTVHGGVEWHPGALALSLHAGTVTRAPSLVERFGNAGSFVGNPALKKERALAVDLGARGRFRAGRFRFEGEFVLFAVRSEDLIAFVPLGAEGRIRATNLGEARMLGAEMSSRASVGPAHLRASYTLMDTRNFARCDVTSTDCSAPRLPGRPVHDLSLDASVDVGRATFRYGLDAVSGMLADEAGAVIVPARALQGLGASYRLPRGLKIGAEVRNLFDVRTASYQGAFGSVEKAIGDVYDYPLPGRSLLVTASFSERTDL